MLRDPDLEPKIELRAKLLARRQAVGPDEVAERDSRRTAAILSRLKKMNPQIIACYVGVEPEPGTLDLLGELVDWGVEILLPSLHSARVPQWAWWSGEPMEPGLGGIPTPTSVPLPAKTLARAEVIILPGLAGTPSGVRLGTGGGWYDRALAHVSTDIPRWLVLNDSEVVDHLPYDPWDQPVTALVTEARWVDCTSANPTEPSGSMKEY